jgi:hypothetical protein
VTFVNFDLSKSRAAALQGFSSQAKTYFARDPGSGDPSGTALASMFR